MTDLDRDGDAREESVVPVELGQQLADHHADGDRLAASSFRIDFLESQHKKEDEERKGAKENNSYFKDIRI